MGYGLSLQYLRETPTAYVADPEKDSFSYEWDVFLFGCLIYEVNLMLYLQSFAYLLRLLDPFQH